MGKLAPLALAASLVAAVTALAWTTTSVQADDARCTHATFQTQLIRSACASGGQLAAKDATKSFTKAHHLSSCTACHANLAPNYDLKPDGLAQLEKLGGT